MLQAHPDRLNSDSKKWHKFPQDVIPMWIADADFVIAPEITAALHERVEHAVFGYGGETEALKDAVIAHCAQHYDWQIEKEWIVLLPGVVPGLNHARAVSILRGKTGGVTMMPVYPHLVHHAAFLDFKQPQNPYCTLENGRWTPDFAALDAAVNEDTGLLLLCHPHNPIGRVYDDEELAQYHAVAKKHDLLVCSDEIHCDLILNGKRHKPFAAIDADALARTITLMAPSKTWNIAGLCCSYAIIADSALRRDFIRVSEKVSDVNILGVTAALAALRHGEPWRQALILALRENAEILQKRLAGMKGLATTPLEGTYLAWIDARGLGVENPADFFVKHGVGMSDGADFGMPGFVRMNLACDKNLLNEALDRMERAIAAISNR